MPEEVDTEDVMDPENSSDEEKDSATEEDVDTAKDIGTEGGVDKEKVVDVENDGKKENVIDTNEEDTETKTVDTGKKKVRKLKLLKNRVTLLHISHKIVGQEMLEKMKKFALEEGDSLKDEDLSELTSLKLISLMEDKGMISMNNCAPLKNIFIKMKENDLEKEQSDNCKYFHSCYFRKTYLFVEGGFNSSNSKSCNLAFIVLFVCVCFEYVHVLLIEG